MIIKRKYDNEINSCRSYYKKPPDDPNELFTNDGDKGFWEEKRKMLPFYIQRERILFLA
jgi:hypothetical protein